MTASMPTLGQVMTEKRIFTQKDINLFAKLSGDNNPVHVDHEFASKTRFGRTICHGLILYGVLCGMLSSKFPSARQLEQDLVFRKPTYPGVEMTFRLEVIEVDPEAKRARLTTTVLGPNDENSLEGQMLIQWNEDAK